MYPKVDQIACLSKVIQPYVVPHRPCTVVSIVEIKLHIGSMFISNAVILISTNGDRLGLTREQVFAKAFPPKIAHLSAFLHLTC